ncbi:internalin [Amycolatopsis sp. WGS_07]|uniref:DUF7927 domain-containing protein n=1 Tax=Amycolatopsis sp. WGS_07 TaxID=3076764 RepID=UPI003873B0FD
MTVPESNCAAASQDPACSTAVPIATLKIAKHASPADPSPGSVVTYTVKVTNDGQAAWAGASVTDDLSDVLDDAAYNNDARATGSGTVRYDEAGRALHWAGDVAAGTTVTITYTVTVGDPPQGNRRLTNRVAGPDGSNCGEDPECTTDEPISGVVIRKSASPATAKPGDTVTYTITAQNIGGAPATAVRLSDDLTGVVDDAAYNGDATATPASTQPVYDPDTAKLTWTGDLEAGATVTITYTVTVHSPPRGDRKLRNAVTGPADSNCAPNSTDPDCATETPIGALEIKKTVDKADAKPGERVSYTVTVRNTGEAAYPGATFTDDLSGVLDDATWNNDATATSGTVSFAAPRLHWEGDVSAGATVTVRYSVTVGSPPAGDHRLRNAVTGPDGSTCDTCTTDTGIGALELSKTASPASAKPGDKVTYTVTARNPGSGTYRGASFTDDLSRVLDDATYNHDATASTGTVNYAEPALTWTADLPAGATATITYSVTVSAAPNGDSELRNAITGPPDSSCPPGNTEPDCNPVTPVARLHVKKTATPSDPRPGDTVTYTVLVANDGKAAYRGATVTDDLTGVLDDATYHNDARATTGTIAYAAPKLTWTGDVEAGATVTITYTVTVHDPPRGDKKLANAVTGGDNCPPGGHDPDCGTVTPLPALKITKSATPGEIKTGDRVSYTITVENVGEADYRSASFADNLAGVLDDATYNGDAKADIGTVAVAPPNLTWTGNLPKGATATITYSVTVTNAGDHRLVNTVTGTGSNCPEGSADPDCRVVLPKPHLRITKTADPAVATPGGKVAYTVTVRNVGEAAQPDASFTDDLSGVLDDATYNEDATASSGTVHFARPRLQWTGAVAAGADVTIKYSVTVGDPPRGDRILRNAVTSPDGTNCETRDPACGTETPVRAMTVTKRAGAATAKPGEKVTYTVDLVNTGTAAYPDAAFVDDLADVLDDASYNQDAQATSGTVDQTGSRLTWHGTLAVGQTVTVTYSITVKPEAAAGRHLRNVVVSPNPGTNCVTGTEPGCATDTPVTPGTPPAGPAGTPPLATTGTPFRELLLGALFSLLSGFALLVSARRRRQRR